MDRVNNIVAIFSKQEVATLAMDLGYEPSENQLLEIIRRVNEKTDFEVGLSYDSIKFEIENVCGSHL